MTKSREPYRVLVIDDNKTHVTGPKLALEAHGEYEVIHALSWAQAQLDLQLADFDIFVIDINLQAEDGREVLKQLRSKQYRQPIILATGNADNLEQPISQYAALLANGPVTFLDKGARTLVDAVKEVAGRVDSLRRALRLLSAAGHDDEPINVAGREITVRELLHPSSDTTEIERQLKESLDALLLRMMSRS